MTIVVVEIEDGANVPVFNVPVTVTGLVADPSVTPPVADVPVPIAILPVLDVPVPILINHVDCASPIDMAPVKSL